MTEEGVAQTDQSQYFYDNWKWRLSSKAIWIGLVFLLLILALLPTRSMDAFWRPANLWNVARVGLLFPALLVPPMTLVVASGGVDLSIGAIVEVVAVVMASLMASGMSPVVALLVGLFLAIFVGLVNGLLVGLTKVHGLVVTLGMSIVLRGIVFVATGARDNAIWVREVGFLESLPVLGSVLALLLMIGVVALTELVPFARKRFLGSRDGESWLRRLALVGSPYVLSGAMAGFVGACYIGILQVGTMGLGTGLEIEILFLVFLGGTALGGGLVNGVGAILAVLTFAVVKYVLMLSGQSAALPVIIRGLGLMVFGLLCQLYYMIVSWVFKRAKSKKTPVKDNHE